MGFASVYINRRVNIKLYTDVHIAASGCLISQLSVEQTARSSPHFSRVI